MKILFYVAVAVALLSIAGLVFNNYIAGVLQ